MASSDALAKWNSMAEAMDCGVRVGSGRSIIATLLQERSLQRSVQGERQKTVSRVIGHCGACVARPAAEVST